MYDLYKYVSGLKGQLLSNRACTFTSAEHHLTLQFQFFSSSLNFLCWSAPCNKKNNMSVA